MDKSFSADPSPISNLEPRIRNSAIYLGSFAALERRWIETVASLQQSDPLFEINTLVGSNILASYLKRRLAESGRAAANIRFHTFLDLAGRLAGVSEPAQEKPRLPRLGASILLEDILAEHAPQVYAPLCGYRGFRDALLDTFRDVRDAGFDSEEFERAVRAGSRAPDRNRHLNAFAELYRRYREQAGFFHDADDDFRSAINNVLKSGAGGFKLLLVYGIYDATGQQSRLLGALRNSVQMIYFIPFVDESISDFARPFLDARSSELDLAPIRLEEPHRNDSLGHLAVRRFGFSGEAANKEPLAADGSFALVSAPGESRAAVEIVREVLRAASDGTIAGFHEAAVILRQPETDIPILAEMFRLHQVPFFIHSGERFSDRPLSKAILSLSNLAANSFAREDVLSAMELVSAALPDDSIADWDVQDWRVLTNNNPRFLARLEAWDEGTLAIVEEALRDLAKAGNQPFERMDDDTESGTRSMAAAEKYLGSAQRLQRAWRLVRQASADWPAKQSWQEWTHFLDEHLAPLLGDSIDWPLFSSVLDEIGGLPEFNFRDSKSEIRLPSENTRNGDISIERLKSAMAESISSLSYPAGRFQRSGVNLLSTSAARGLRFPLVVIPGLDEGRFPAKLRQDPLLLDSDRLQMKNLPLKSKRIEEEKLLFDMTSRSAEKRLVLMTSRLDESSDRERIASQFFLRVAAASRGAVVSIRDLTPDVIPGFRSVSLDNPAPAKDAVAIDEGEIKLRLITAGSVAAHASLEALAEMDPRRLQKPIAYDRARWKSEMTNFDGLLRDPDLIQRTAKIVGISAGQVSASRIEEYAKCPYYFFLKRVMNLEAWEEQRSVEGMDPLARGTAIHSILENFLRNSGEEIFRSASQETLQASLERLALKELEIVRPVGIPDLLWEIERDSLLAMLRNWIQFEIQRSDPDMRIARLEQSFGQFGKEQESAAFRVKAGRHEFRFRGRIDRVDVSHDGKRARVIDYKTGTLPESMSENKRTPLMSGERIQVVVYRGALQNLDAFKGVESIVGEYLHLQPKDGETAPCSFGDEELQKAAQALPAILEIVGDGIEGGIFFARTSGAVRPYGHCEYCDYLTICGKERKQREERKAKDPAVVRFLKILEPQQ